MKNDNNYEQAYFAWGCFWCIEQILKEQNWVIETSPGYAWWTIPNPTYSLVSSWKTDYRETVKVLFDPNEISYKELVDIFLRQIDPTDDSWQFVDRWFQYTTAIFYVDSKQEKIALEAIENLEKSNKFEKKIVTKVIKYSNFYDAEEYHKDYYKTSPFRYNLYKKASWREEFIKENWTNKNNNLKNKLTPLQYDVTQKSATEPAFNNEYWDNNEDWIYVDIVDWTPLFTSLDKYDSWCWWPSFTKPINNKEIDEIEDNSLYMSRTEVRSKKADSHLWHVFSDWPKNKWWLRYCINSASLKFIAYEELEENWYWEYKKLFE